MSGAQYEELEATKRAKAAASDELLLVGILESAVPCAACSDRGALPPSSCCQHVRAC
jgi:hypothetical protein